MERAKATERPKPAAARGAGQGNANQARIALVASIAVTVLLYWVPYGRLVGYPLVLVSTLAHEMGHGLTAMLVGGHFEKLEMWSDASGLAHWHGDVGRIARGLVAAGGLVGPAVAAALCFVAGRRPLPSRVFVLSVGALLVLAEVLVVRTIFGFFFVGVLAAALLAVGIKGSPKLSQWLLAFLAVQLALSVFSRGDYLFTDVAHMAGGSQPSDVALMSDALLLPYWFWGAVCGAFSVAVLLAGVWLHVRPAGGLRPSAARGKRPPPVERAVT